MDHPFRSAVFGGFNRQDVLTYLENTAKESAQRQAELEKRLNESESLATRQDAQLAEQEERLTRLQQENQELRTRLDQANQALSTSQTRCSQHSGDLEAARRELEELKQRAASLEPDAAAYAAVKDRTAGIELDAHRRAQSIQDEAEEQARQLRRRTEEWLQRLNQSYDALRSEVESTVSHASDKLDKANKALEQVTDLLEQQSAAWDRLTHSYEEGGPLLEESASSPEQ